MAKHASYDVRLDVRAGTKHSPERPAANRPLRILILGDFSGRGNRKVAEPVRWAPRRVDRDDFDQVLASMEPGLQLGGKAGRAHLELHFREMEDFHPDRIFERAACFHRLREARRALTQPGSVSSVEEAKRREAAPSEISRLTSGSLLDDILEASAPETSGAPCRGGAFEELLERTVAPHLIPPVEPQRAQKLRETDSAAAELMRAILHHPDFQELEAAWRSAFFLVRHLETGEDLKLYLLDITKDELAEDLEATRHVRHSKLHRLLVEEAAHTLGAEPWAIVAGNYTFGRHAEDARMLLRLSEIMQAAGAAFLAEADPASEPTEEWGAVRRRPSASWVGLALPRVLLRLPYGKDTSSVESFDFEEMPSPPEHHRYLWGNPAFACVYLLGQAFCAEGWDFRPGSIREIRGLPLHVYEEGGEKRVKPCAEVWMTEEEAEWAMDQGFMPLASLKNRDAVLLLRFQSIADPPAALSGPWG